MWNKIGSEKISYKEDIKKPKQSLNDEINDKLTNLSDDFERNNFSETPEQVMNHVSAILKSLNSSKIFKDKIISQKEIKEIKEGFKLSIYEISYLTTGIAYLSRVHPDKFKNVLKKEVWVSDLDAFLTNISIELPDWRKKSLLHAMIENRNNSISNEYYDKITFASRSSGSVSILEKNPKNILKETPKTSVDLQNKLSKEIKWHWEEFFRNFWMHFEKLSSNEKTLLLLSIADNTKISPLLLKTRQEYLSLPENKKQIIKNIFSDVASRPFMYWTIWIKEILIIQEKLKNIFA